jgi:shikimate dehydrogenase
MITGKTTLIAHIGYPTEHFKAPMIYNPWFNAKGIDAVVVPMGVKPEDYVQALASIRKFTNLKGALITMPHKVTTMSLVDEASPTAHVAGACNALLVRPDGSLLGDQFDGLGFVLGLKRKGFEPIGKRALVVGSGGVGSAIAASLADAGLAELTLFDARAAGADGLAQRLQKYFPKLKVNTGNNDPHGYDLVVNATPMGAQDGDPLPFDVTRLVPGTYVGEVVMKQTITPLLAEAQARNCPIQTGAEMLIEMIPAYLKFFGFGEATPEELLATANKG